VIFGIGTDMVSVQRMEDNLVRYGERFARRILTEQEWEGYQVSVRKAHFLAKRFAAKEAVAKAMGTGFRNGLSLRDVGVGHDVLGKPIVELSARARRLLQELGVGGCHLSISDEQAYALAFVTLEQVLS